MSSQSGGFGFFPKFFLLNETKPQATVYFLF